MSQVSQLLALKAMDGLYLRQTAIAQNVANSGSDSFALKVVDFETQLRAAFAEGSQALEGYAPQIESRGPAMNGEEIRLDLEMQSASATAMRYAALSDILGRQMQIARAAIRGGQ